MPVLIQAFKWSDFVLLDMNICICNSELEYLKKYWNDLTDNQRGEVIEICYDCDCIPESTLDDLTLRWDTPHMEDTSTPDFRLCLEVLDKMTPEEQKALESYVEMSISDIKEQIIDSTALFYVLSNYLARNFMLNLPPLKLFVIPDRYEVPMTIRKRVRTHLKHHRSSHRPIP